MDPQSQEQAGGQKTLGVHLRGTRQKHPEHPTEQVSREKTSRPGFSVAWPFSECLVSFPSMAR